MSADERRTPAVSVCIPLYCKEEFIAGTIQSVLDQTFTDFELLILENASTDRSGEIARSFDDPRIVIVENEETLPPIDNFNRAVELSSAPLVKVLCADDLIHPECLERQVSVLREDGALTMTTCRHHLIDETGRMLARDRNLRQSDLIGWQERTTVLRRLVRHGGNPIGLPSNVLFRRDAFDAAGGFPRDEDFYTVELALWLNLLEHGNYYGTPETLISFRINAGSDSKRLGKQVNDISRDFINGVCRDNADIVRRKDLAFSAVRAPLTRLRHSMLLAAAGHKERQSTRLARRLLSVDRRVSEPRR